MVGITNLAVRPRTAAPPPLDSITGTPCPHTAAPSVTFERLPAEILKKIAGYCPSHDLLALGRTSKHLHAICNDVLIIQDCFLNHMDNPTLQGTPDKDALLKALRCRLGAEDDYTAKQIWLRFAQVAAEQLAPGAIHHSPFIHHFYKRIIDHFTALALTHTVLPRAVFNSIGALSTFSVLGYPGINSIKATHALLGLSYWILAVDILAFPQTSENRIFAAQSSFCLANGTIQNWGWIPPAYTSKFRDSIGHHVGTDKFIRLSDSVHGSYIEHHQTIALMIVALMSTIIFYGPDKTPRPLGPPFLNVVGRGGQIPLPMARAIFVKDDSTRIPRNWTKTSQSLRHFNNPNSWLRWLQNNLDNLAEDMFDDEWAGHCFVHPQRGRSEKPDRSFHFQQTQERRATDYYHRRRIYQFPWPVLFDRNYHSFQLQIQMQYPNQWTKPRMACP